jgi:PhoPQ-activated pathogenicity-related protein
MENGPCRQAFQTLFLFLLAVSTSAANRTALDEYVARADPNYAYNLVDTVKGESYTSYILQMTSQQYLTTNEVDRPIWKHWLIITKPDKIEGTTGLLSIGGGSNESPAPKRPDGNLVKVALASKSVVTELKDIPNQPLTFKGETKGRSEDALIAYTWDKFLRTGDSKWPARLPMTKSAVRALDTITAFCASDEGGKIKVNSFVVAGGSKRGWTTWTTAAVDKRVVAIVPIVIDLLNIVPSFKHHYSAYGFWAPAVGDYEAMGIMRWSGTPEYAALMGIEEPYTYRERFTMPKFLINSAGDQFFLPDSAQFYFKDLPGQKYLRYVPNSDHSLKNTDAIASLLAFYDAILHHKTLPEFSWSLPSQGVIRVEPKTKPSMVKLWQATDPNARDFRLEKIGPAYTSQELKAAEDGSYTAKVEKPEKGFTAYFVELTYENDPAPYKFTTQVVVIPDLEPFKDKVPPSDPLRDRAAGQ